MISIVIDSKNINNNCAIIDKPTDINHIVNVYRHKEEDLIRLVDGQYEYIAKIEKISKKLILANIIEKKEDEYNLNINIDIALGIIKNDNMNLVLQKLTEIGANKVIPLKTQRVVVKINEKKEKWDCVITESMKQCRAIKKMQLEKITNLKDLNFEKYDKVIFLYEKSNNKKKITDIINNDNKNILCIIGPEGGFTEQEAQYLKNKGAIEITLGKRILRAETACILVASVIAHNFGY